MKPKLVFDLSKLKGSKTMEAYEGYLGKETGKCKMDKKK